MIFGFNTDIRHDDTVYHVQSEAREAEQLLQTQVFVRGRCIGKRAIPFGPVAENSVQGNDQDMEKRLRELHREVLDAIRDGKLDSIFDKRDSPETLAAVKELDLQWINSGSVHSSGALTMQIRVTDGGVNCRRCSPHAPFRPARRRALLRAGPHRRQRQRRDECSGRRKVALRLFRARAG